MLDLCCGKGNICQAYQNKKNQIFDSIVTSWIKPFPASFLENAWKPLKLTHIIAPEKVCPSVEQNEIDIYRLLIKGGKYTWKWTCSMHGLYVFWKKSHPNLHVFSTKLTFSQIYGNFIISVYSTEQFVDQIECIFVFLMYPLFECHG
jgi:hypothetical protein